VAIYPDPISKRFLAACARSLDKPNAVGTSASFVCGSFARVSLQIAVDGSIEDASFSTNGCGFMIASADVIGEWLRGKALTDLHGLNDTELSSVVHDQLGEFPADRSHCIEVVFEALHKALFEYRESRIQEFKGEQALICTCFGVTEDTIVDVISSHSLHDVDEVADICRAGAGCGSCRMLIRELIDSREGG
jgi:NifU-like protein